MQRQEDLTDIIQKEIRPIQRTDSEEFLQKRYQWQIEAKAKMLEIEAKARCEGVAKSQKISSRDSHNSTISESLNKQKNIIANIHNDNSSDKHSDTNSTSMHSKRFVYDSQDQDYIVTTKQAQNKHPNSIQIEINKYQFQQRVSQEKNRYQDLQHNIIRDLNSDKTSVENLNQKNMDSMKIEKVINQPSIKAVSKEINETESKDITELPENNDYIK